MDIFVNTRGNKYSKIAMDMMQEHSNKIIKSRVSGYIDLTNNDDKRFLHKIELGWPEINIFPQWKVYQQIRDTKKQVKSLLEGIKQSTVEFARLSSSYISLEVVFTDHSVHHS